MNLLIWPVLRNFLPASAATVHYRFPIFNSEATPHFIIMVRHGT